MNKINITPETKVSELLNEYPELENKLIELAPPFKKLKNPILRKTVTRVTTLRQASQVGGVSLANLINELRKEAGQNYITKEIENPLLQDTPGWFRKENIIITYDARIDLENGVHPAGKVSKEILALEKDQLYLLITPFVPAPLIDIIRSKGFKVFSEITGENEVCTYIGKE